MRWLLALLLVVGVVACSDESPAPGGSSPPTVDDVDNPSPDSDPSASADGVDGTWGLTSGHGPSGEIPLVEEYPITLQIDGRNIGGTSSCNYYGGKADIEGTSFELDEDTFNMTLIGCSGDVATAEDRYLAAIRDVDTIERTDDGLSMTGPDSELSFESLPPPPTASLKDTTWHLTSLVHGSEPEAVVSSAAPAELILHSGGKLEGSTGCRELNGEWYQSGNQIRFTTFGAEGNCPPDLQDQDDQVVGVLGDGFTAEIEGEQLTVYAARGPDGLIYSSSG